MPNLILKGPVDSVSYGPAGVGEISSNSVQNLIGTNYGING